MSANADLTALIQEIAGTRNEDKVRLFICSVNSVNESNRTANVTTINGSSELTFDANLNAGKGDGFVSIPKDDSEVYVLTSKYTNPFIVAYSDIVSYFIKGGEFGGLVKVIELTEKLNNLESDINDLKQAFTSWTPVTQDGGAALKATAATWSSSILIETQQSDIENEKVKHGNS